MIAYVLISAELYTKFCDMELEYQTRINIRTNI